MKQSVATSATIDLNAVSAFVRVVEAGSFTLAAQQIGLPKSAVSRRVARLEEALGTRLLQRTTRRLSLTDEGARYYQQAAESLSGLSEAASEIGAQQGEPRGVVRFTAPADLAVAYLMEPLAAFAARYPLVSVEAVLTSRFVDLVGERVDFALRAGKLRDSALVARRIAATPLVIVASPAYLDRRGTPGAPEEIASHDCVLFRPESGRATWSLLGPGGEERSVPVSGKLGTDDLDFVRALALKGAGLALLPWHGCVNGSENPRLLRVLPQWRGQSGLLSLVYARSRHVPRRVALLREHLFEHLRGALAVSTAALPEGRFEPENGAAADGQQS